MSYIESKSAFCQIVTLISIFPRSSVTNIFVSERCSWELRLMCIFPARRDKPGERFKQYLHIWYHVYRLLPISYKEVPVHEIQHSIRKCSCFLDRLEEGGYIRICAYTWSVETNATWWCDRLRPRRDTNNDQEYTCSSESETDYSCSNFVTEFCWAKYTPRHIDGIFGEIMTGSSLHTMMKKRCSDINLSTNPIYSSAFHLNCCKYREQYSRKSRAHESMFKVVENNAFLK